MEKYTILAVDDDVYSLENIKLSLEPKGYNLHLCGTANEAVELIKEVNPIVAIIDLKLRGTNGLSIVEKTKADNPFLKFLIITGYSDEESFIKATKLGVHDILKKPYEEAELQNSVRKLIELAELEKENKRLKEKLEKENLILKQQFSSKFELDKYIIVGESAKLKKELHRAVKIAKHSLNTLITGESGTGKELMARYIHSNGARADKPFIPINCAALSPSLFESELFGYEKGAFTNAFTSKAGLFEIAHEGILFLDEITEITLDLQAKLLRVVENNKVKRIGSNKSIDIDVQIISSTNRDIKKALKDNVLREDLYHRIAGTTLNLPPLRERREDIELLLKHFISSYEKSFDIKCPEITENIMKDLSANSWSGNIRQLSNFIKNWCLFGNESNDQELKTWMTNGWDKEINTENAFYFIHGTMHELEEAKKWLVHKMLNKYDGNKSKTAEHLGLSYAGLLKMLKSFDKN